MSRHKVALIFLILNTALFAINIAQVLITGNPIGLGWAALNALGIYASGKQLGSSNSK